ncbi:MAG TPA: EamA family transporter [Verrucomicrobiae bacterium]|nr:EamA family transporter [Verrucomicrobiae bacterium]
MTPSRTARIAVAFAIVYLVWGSTYLAIRIGVQALPPGLFSGLRFLIAAALMLAFAFARGAALPKTARDWRNIALTSLLMLVGGNGCVVWAEQWIESNQAALIVATSALWLAWMGTWGAKGERLAGLTLLGLGLGFGGVVVLVWSGLRLQAGPPIAYVVLSFAPILWAAGSIWSRRAPVSCPPAMTSACQMLVAGVAFSLLGFAAGEAPRWTWSVDAMLVVLYLAVFGSCIAYSAYIWLVHEVTPSTLGTYAYVNPAVAVILGWWILDEHLNATQVLGTAIILAGVLLVTWAARRPVSSRAQRGIA